MIPWMITGFPFAFCCSPLSQRDFVSISMLLFSEWDAFNQIVFERTLSEHSINFHNFLEALRVRFRLLSPSGHERVHDALARFLVCSSTDKILIAGVGSPPIFSTGVPSVIRPRWKPFAFPKTEILPTLPLRMLDF